MTQFDLIPKIYFKMSTLLHTLVHKQCHPSNIFKTMIAAFKIAKLFVDRKSNNKTFNE